jgi:Carboxypeptidase regulatory-like domain/TonB dependent receptor
MPITRVTSLPIAVVVCLAGFSSQAAAQVPPMEAVAQIAAAHGELQGLVTDERGEPLAGAVVSALGSTTSFAVTDRAGRFTFRTLPPGPYLLRAHLQGYVAPRARMVRINSAGRASWTVALTRRPGPDSPPQVLAAGVGAGEQPVPTTGEAITEPDHDHGEAAWRLRHLKRSVLKEVEGGILAVKDEGSFIEESFGTIGRAMGYSARAASSLFGDLPQLSGEVNFLTTRSFDRPQDLFSLQDMPRGVAFISLTAPAGAGDWNIRGAMMQGDLDSWVVAGSYMRKSPATHQYEAGMLYSMQRYGGGNPAALTTVADGSRNVGEVFAYDRWTIRQNVRVHYGARYARYDYLEDDVLFSPRIGVIIGPAEGVRLRVTASRRELAPGAEEFAPEGVLGVWLPPERTFSPISSRGFQAERIEHYEIASEHDMSAGMMLNLRAFRQRVDDQMVTLFDVSVPGHTAPDLGHYYVASGGDFEARGWGIGVSRQLTGHVRGSLDYTRTDAEWSGEAPDARVLSILARSTNRADSETLHDLTTSIQSEFPLTATRVFILYKLNSGFAANQAVEGTGRAGSRFDLQINQALPFLDFTAAKWEMLLTVRNLFREDFLDASIYDELLVVKPPKRIVGGLTVRF